MKRRVLPVVIVGALLLATWFGFLQPVIVRVRQNNASVDMMWTKNKLEQYVREKKEWPRTWQDLFPEGVTSAGYRDVSRTTKVNWQASLEQAIDFIERLDAKQREEASPDVDPPIFVEYSDRVPRNDDLVFSERQWNWMIAQSLHREHGGQVSSP